MNTHIAISRHLAELYRALAHPVRLQLLHLLLQDEACVCHLTCVMRRPQPYISQQLGRLRDAGLVTDRRDGQIVYYRAAHPASAGIIALGQQILREQGLPADLQGAAGGPVAGCTCPKCAERAV